MGLLEVARQPLGPALELGDRPLAAGELLEEVLDEVLLCQPLDQLDLLERDGGLIGDGSGEVDLRRSFGDEEAEQLVACDERRRDP
jgi:hypothetical protein